LYRKKEKVNRGGIFPKVGSRGGDRGVKMTANPCFAWDSVTEVSEEVAS